MSSDELYVVYLDETRVLTVTDSMKVAIQAGRTKMVAREAAVAQIYHTRLGSDLTSPPRETDMIAELTKLPGQSRASINPGAAAVGTVVPYDEDVLPLPLTRQMLSRLDPIRPNDFRREASLANMERIAARVRTDFDDDGASDSDDGSASSTGTVITNTTTDTLERMD